MAGRGPRQPDHPGKNHRQHPSSSRLPSSPGPTDSWTHHRPASTSHTERTAMSNPLLVMAPEPKDFVITLEQFRAALDYWQPHAHLINPLSSDTVDAGIEVDRPDQPAFQVLHSRNADVLFSDG